MVVSCMYVLEFYVLNSQGLSQAAALVRSSVGPLVFVNNLHIHRKILPALSSK